VEQLQQTLGNPSTQPVSPDIVTSESDMFQTRVTDTEMLVCLDVKTTQICDNYFLAVFHFFLEWLVIYRRLHSIPE